MKFARGFPVSTLVNVSTVRTFPHQVGGACAIAEDISAAGWIDLIVNELNLTVIRILFESCTTNKN